MQGLTTSCVQQRIALVRCGDSKDKKSRRRKTREERRTLVESFINNYRLSNDGKFPSLSLTHKEVGGSFYIVREIVRDIIQENRVLGPGNQSMKALTLEDCFEDHETEYVDESPHIELSKSSIGLAFDEQQIGISSQLCRSEDSDELVKSDNEEFGASDQDSHFFSHVICHEPNNLPQNSTGANKQENLVTLESEEVNLRKPSLQTHGKTENSEESGFAVQDGLEKCKVQQDEQPEPLYETLSITSPEEMLVVNKDLESLAEAANMFAEKNGNCQATGAGALPEGEVFASSLTTSNDLFNNLASSEEEFSSLVSSATKADSELPCMRKDDSVGNPEAFSNQNLPNEQEELSMQINKHSVLNGTELIENTTSGSGDELTNSTLLVSQNSLVPSSGSLQTELPVFDSEGTKRKTECVSAESLSPSMQEISTTQLKPGHEADGSGLDKGSCCSSMPGNSNKEIQSETNPVWKAIRAFVAHFVKFWTE